MKRTAVLNVVGLSESLLGESTPQLNAFRARSALTRIEPAFPAVTCTAQSTYLTGLPPAGHGVVANGWFNRELSEVQFWKQSNRIVQGKKLWEALREQDARFTCAQLFWWYNMYAAVDWAMTPRPMYPADGRKIFGIYTWPCALGVEVQRELGAFPFPAFWGPAAGVDSTRFPADAVSQWIAAAAKWVEEKHAPTLNLIYLPHLDYNLQRLGPQHPGIPQDLRRLDALVGDLITWLERRSVQVVVLSEYGISAVETPVHLNRRFRELGWLVVKEELGRELLDCGASRVFAVADHQVAHVYVQDAALIPTVRTVLERQPGVGEVWGEAEKRQHQIHHPRAGELIAIAKPSAWFTYYYWHDDRRAPDFARTVDIHRKPGYDPVELFLNPQIACVKARIAWRLLQKRLGFRMLMDVIPLDATLVKGSHGARPANPREWPICIGGAHGAETGTSMPATGVYDWLYQTVLGRGRRT